MINLLVKTNPFCGLCLPISKFRVPMQEHHGGTTFRSGLDDMQADAVGVYITMFEFHKIYTRP